MTKTNKGFTLIELLVVIAIIAILAMIAIAQLGNARNRAKDTAIMGELSGLRAHAELVALDNSGDYSTLCTSTTVTNSGITVDACHANANAWVISKALVSDTAESFCVDSQGAAHKIATSNAPTAVGACAAAI